MNSGLALGVKDTKDLGKILNYLFSSPPPTNLDKETVKQAVKHFMQEKIELIKALDKFAFPFVSQNITILKEYCGEDDEWE